MSDDYTNDRKIEAKFSILDTYIRLGMPPAVAIQETETLVRYIFDGVIPAPLPHQFDEAVEAPF